MDWLQARGRFRTVQDGAGQVGHTHNKQDQSLGGAATSWSRTRILETPDDFADVLWNTIHPTRNRKLVVVKLKGFFDWQEFFSPLKTDWHGIAATRGAPYVCHSKRMMSRRDIPQMDLPGWGVATP